MNIEIVDLVFSIALAAISVVAIIWFLAAKYVYGKSDRPSDIKPTAVGSPHVNAVDEHGRKVVMDVLATRLYVDRLARHYEDWAEAFVKDKISSAFKDATAEVVKAADGRRNLAHIRHADVCGPDLLVRLPEGATLVKVGAGEFDVVIAPVSADLPNGPERTPSGHDGTDGGHEGNDKRKDLKGSHARDYIISKERAESLRRELMHMGGDHSYDFMTTVLKLIEGATK